MSAAAHSTSSSSTAAVLEYQCLFTHDLRRKQKRWQDGRLKFHTFNKRVMVYDERGNFIGDMHWQHDYAFDEGEEVELQRGGTIVQVSCLVARGETDLSELLDKRAKEKEQRQIRQIARSPAATAILPRTMPRPSALPLEQIRSRHRPLHQVIGIPTGHHGRALVPNESPFEQRQQAACAADTPDGRAAKRRKHDAQPPSKSGYATNLFGQSLTLSATPASSVPMQCPPRLELNSGPPSQADHLSARGEAVSVPLERPKISRQLNQKSGYAQGLFGQSLTLSHVPVSSLPSRRQPQHEPNSGSTLDTDARESQINAQPPLREHPKTSHHFNNRASRSQIIGPEKQANSDRNTQGTSNKLAESNVSCGSVKKNRNLPPDRSVNQNKHVAPVDEDVIEIDDSEPIPAQAVRKPRLEKGTINQQTLDKSKVPISRQKLNDGKLASSRQAEQEDEQESETEKIYEPAPINRTKSVASKTTDKTREADHVALKMNQEVPRSFATSRRPDEPVTELRIRSRKRGLLMIANAPEKPGRQTTSNPIRHSDGTEKPRSRDNPDVYNLSRSSSPEVGARTSIRRTISTELGDFNDPFRSSSPAPQEKLTFDETASTKDSNGQQKQTSTEDLHKVDNELNLDYVNIVIGEASIVDQATTHPSSPPNRVYDPYRIPSSPEEDPPFSWSKSSKRMKSPTNCDSEEGPEDDVPNAHEDCHKPNTLRKTKKQRRSRRKFVLEDDEEPELLPGIPDQTPVSLDDTDDDASEVYEAASKPIRAQKREDANEKRHKPQDVIADPEAGDEEYVEAIKQKAKKHHKEACSDSQDEPAEKRRRSTRQRRGRVSDYEEISLSSEQDHSEEEQGPKTRRCRTSKTVENRPRLERIKRNVKSRELIGFNLTSLNAPLGPRGIGMPFSILQSPIDGSIERHISNEAVTKASSVLDVDNGVEQASHITTRIHSEPHHVQAQHGTVAPGVKEQLMGEKKGSTNASGSHVVNKDLGGSSQSPDAPEPEESTRIVSSHDHRIVNDHGSINSEAPTNRTQPLNVAGDTALETKAPQTAPIPTQATQTPSARAIEAAASITTLQDSIIGLERRTSTNEGDKNVTTTRPQLSPTAQDDDGRGAVARDNLNASEDIRVEPAAGLAARSRVTAPFKKPVPASRRQRSMVTIANNSHANSAEDVPETASAGPSTIGAALQRPTLPPVRPSSVEDMNTMEGSCTAGEKPGSNPAPAGQVHKQKSIGLRRQVTAPRRVNNIIARPPQIDYPEHQTGDSVARAAARIVNPASRGRKAALASDAVGQVPQRVLPPTQPALLVPISTADLACTPFEPPPKEPERPKKKMTFPGFQSARGDGPWSREAFDLLESGRPV